MSITEKRFVDGTGERYCADGRIRCQAVAKGRLRKWREEFGDDETPAEDTWPETQCNRAAEEGYYVCKWHGGKSKSKKAPKTIYDTMPKDLAAKLQVLYDNPDYISRREDILLIKARQWELLEKLDDELPGDEAWGMVEDGLHKINLGEDLSGKYLIEQALLSVKKQKDVWNEIYKSQNILKDLTNTQVKTAKELRLMASQEQVMHMIASIYEIMLEKADQFIDDPTQREKYIESVARDVRQLTKPSTAVLIEQTQ